MKNVHLRSRANADGTLELNVPTGMPDTDLEITIVLQPTSSSSSDLAAIDAWHRFISETAGSIFDPSFVRHPHGCGVGLRAPA